MKVFEVDNVQQALGLGLLNLERHGIERNSRNGKVIVFPTPITTLYRKPIQRVIFWAERDANPFFHFFESLWMLAGRNDTKFIMNYVKSMQNYSDDGNTFHGAYGFRWRTHFGVDQLQAIIDILSKNPDDRRCVLQMWDATCDLGLQGKDFPCNTQVVFSINSKNQLDMSVFNRSNDLIWGAYGANAVHFSFLQEYVACALKIDVGVYYQISNNLHAYKEVYNKLLPLAKKFSYLVSDPPRLPIDNDFYIYENKRFCYFPLMTTEQKIWDEDLKLFFENGPIVGFRDAFFTRVVTPLYHAHNAYKTKTGLERYDLALEILEQCKAEDWQLACKEWILRRKEKFLKANDDGVSYDS